MSGYRDLESGSLGVVARNRRAVNRRPVFYRLDVTDHADNQAGYLVDLTASGMRVRCSEDLDLNSIERLRILFPRWMQLGEGLTLNGHFVWAKPSSNGNIEGGFVFTCLKGRVKEVLDLLIELIAQAAMEDKLL